MKHPRILVGLGIIVVASCSAEGGGGSNTSWVQCETDLDCGNTEVCVNLVCMKSDDAGIRASGGASGTSSGGSPSTGGATGTGGTTNSGGSPDASAAGGIASAGGSGSLDGGLLLPDSSGVHDAGTVDATSLVCANGTFGTDESVGGAGYSDKGSFGDPQTRVFVAPDGSAFTAWLAYDAAGSFVSANAARYTPASGWVSYLQFDRFNPAYGGSTPAVAVSDNGEAMLLWRHATGDDGGISYVLMSMRYTGHWEAPVQVQGPTSDTTPVLYQLGADAHGDFVAAWIQRSDVNGDIRMTRYTRGAGWGATVDTPTSAPDGGQSAGAFAMSVSTAPTGNALVTWAEGGQTGRYSVHAERFEPSTGFGGNEPLVVDVLGQLTITDPVGAVGDDGTAAVTWSQYDRVTQQAHPMVRTFSGSWSPLTNLSDAGSSGLDYFYGTIATDFHGTFMTAWAEHDQFYVSRLTPGGSWTSVLLNPPDDAPDGAHPAREGLASQIAMNEAGDAVATWSDWNQPANTYTVDATTFTPRAGWAKVTRLETDSRDTAPLQIDPCGTATLAWTRYPSSEVMTARHAPSGAWTTPTRLGSTPGNGYTMIATGVGANGETIVSWRTPDDHDLRASVSR